MDNSLPLSLLHLFSDNQSSKIEDFFNQSDFLIKEMLHRDQLSKNVFLSKLSKGETFLKNWSFGCTIITNLLIIWYENCSISSNTYVLLSIYISHNYFFCPGHLWLLPRRKK